MISNPRRHPATHVLVALTVIGAQPIGLAGAQPTIGSTQHRSFSAAQTDAGTWFDPAGWTLQDHAQLAVVGAYNNETGVFAGMQCDPIDPRAHRLIFGALRTAHSADLMALFDSQNAKMVVSTNGASLSAKFEIHPEDRGQSNFGGASSYAAAYLNRQQFEALNSAHDFAIQIGAHSYKFSGVGSARTISTMACRTVERHVASRVIESRNEDASQQKQGSWHLAFHTGTTAMTNGRAEAFASTTNHPSNSAANFRISVSCYDRRLYAHLDVKISEETDDEAGSATINAFMSDYKKHGKLVEVYRAGHSIATFMVESTQAGARRHALSNHEFDSLMKSDAVAVVGDNKVIDFSTVNAAASLDSLSRFCSSTS